MDELRDIGTHQAERVAFGQMGDVGRRPGDEVVQAQHLVTLVEQPLAQVGTEEAGATGDDGTPTSART
jgi:hypothetical protein